MKAEVLSATRGTQAYALQHNDGFCSGRGWAHFYSQVVTLGICFLQTDYGYLKASMETVICNC